MEMAALREARKGREEQDKRGQSQKAAREEGGSDGERGKGGFALSPLEGFHI